MKQTTLIWFMVTVIICQGYMLYYLSKKLEKIIEQKAREDNAQTHKAVKYWKDVEDLINEKNWEEVK